jgi:hypothetical protein
MGGGGVLFCPVLFDPYSSIKNPHHYCLSSFLPEPPDEAHLSPKAASRLLWLFINFLALQMHYCIYNRLREEAQLSKYCPKDILMRMSRLHKIKIQGEWRTSESPRKTKEIIQKLKTRIT